MSIDISIQNFRNIREARLVDENNFSIIIGYNESGKSSLIGAVQFACTGTAFGRKASSMDGLITRGADRMAVRIQVNNIMVTRTKTGGDSIKSVAERFGVTTDTLPLLFDSKMNGDGGSKAMRAFLDGAASSAFDALSHFANDPPIYELVLKARAAGKLTTKSIIEFCESMRANCRVPTALVMPSFNRPTAEEIEMAQKMASNAETVMHTKISEFTDSTLLGQKLTRLSNYKTALATYEKQRAAAASVDPLKERRQALLKVTAINEGTMIAIANVLTEAGFSNQANAVTMAKAHVDHAKITAQQALTANPTPASMPTPPELDDEAFKTAVELGAPATDTVNAVAFFSFEQLRELLTSSAQGAAESKIAQDAATNNVRTLSAARDELFKRAGAWEAYDHAVPAYEGNKTMVESEWMRWDIAAKTVAKAEIDHVNKAGDVFGQLVSDFSASILQGRKIRVSRDEGIFLGQDRIDDCSESTRFRIEAAIMAAVGVMLKSPLLMLDGADILDPINKILFQNFLLQSVVPRFKHVIVTTTTARDLKEEVAAPPGLGVTKWIVDDGKLKKL